MKQKILSCFLLFFVFSLVGCSIQEFEVALKSNEIEYEREELDVCQYIKTINDTKIRESFVSDGKINEKDYEVSCNKINVRKLGKQEATISVNGIDVIVNFKVVDTTAPKINIKSDVLKVEEGNEYFDLKSLVKVEDAYDKNVVVGFTGNYDLEKTGKYTVEVSATDSQKNKATKTITIIVNEKEVEVVEKEAASNSTNHVVNNTITNNQVNNNAGNSTTTNKETISSPLAKKEFLFSAGYDMLTGFDACTQYKANHVGACEPLQQENGIAYGYIYLPK